MKTISIDPSSTSSGYAVFEDGQLTNYGAFDHSKNKNTEERLHEMGASLLSFLKKEKPDAIYIEKPDGHNQNIAEMLGEMIGVVRSYSIAKSIYFEKIKPTQWRSWLELGIAKRDEMKQRTMDYVSEVCGVDASVNDISDAIAIGLAAMKHYT